MFTIVRSLRNSKMEFSCNHAPIGELLAFYSPLNENYHTHHRVLSECTLEVRALLELTTVITYSYMRVACSLQVVHVFEEMCQSIYNDYKCNLSDAATSALIE